MPSERIQRQIDRLLDEAEAAVSEGNWGLAGELTRRVLTLDPGNDDARAFLAAAERGLGSDPQVPVAPPSPPPEAIPDAFGNGRYKVKRFLGEGGKKKVYLAHDTKLDRDIAFALIKTEGLDEASLPALPREAMAMGRLGH